MVCINLKGILDEISRVQLYWGAINKLFPFYDSVLLPRWIILRADETLWNILVIVHGDAAGWVIIWSKILDTIEILLELITSFIVGDLMNTRTPSSPATSTPSITEEISL